MGDLNLNKIMKNSKNPWLTSVKKTTTGTKKFLSHLSVKVRTSQYKIFNNLIKPNEDDLVLDVGVSSMEIYDDSNMLEKLYPYPQNLTAATIEDCKVLKKLYPKINAVQTKPGEKLPFKKNQFDIVTSWATLEHVGDEEDQRFFLSELSRVGKRIFLTTPYKYCFYEPHSGVFFLHWLPDKWFRAILRFRGKDFWANEKNLRPLSLKSLQKIFPNQNFRVIIYRTFGLIPSHLVIYKEN